MPGSLRPFSSGLEDVLEPVVQARSATREARAALEAALVDAKALIRDAVKWPDRSADALATLRRRALALLDDARQRVQSFGKGVLVLPVQRAVEDLEAARREVDRRLKSLESDVRAQDKTIAELDGDLDDILTRPELVALRATLQDIAKQAADVEAKLETWSLRLTAWPDALREGVRVLLEAYGDIGSEEALEIALEHVRERVSLAEEEIRQDLAELRVGAKREVAALCEKLFDDLLGDAASALEEFLSTQLGALAEALEQAVSLPDIEGALDELLATPRRKFQQIGDHLRERLSGLDDLLDSPIAQNAEETLRLVRALGDAPLVPSLQFNRDRLAYFFDDAKGAVETSPAVALVNRVGDDLKAMGMRVPTKELLQGVLPDALEDFDLSKILPDFGGLKLDDLFEGIRFPKIDDDRVKVKHGFDKTDQSAWLDASAVVPLAGAATVFSVGPIKLELLRAVFRGHFRMAAGTDGRVDEDLDGRITGDWRLTIGGLKLVTFAGTSLSFDEGGNLDFDIRPDRIQVDRALEFLAEAVASLGDPDSGFAIELIQRGGFPVGVRSTLDLPIPPVSFGAFGLSGLRLGASFFVLAAPGPGGVNFSLGTTFSIGRKTEPFTLTIFILGGGGWFESTAVYEVSKGRLSTRVTVGIVAGAGLEFAFGPIRGGVFIQFGVFAEFAANDPAQADGLTIGIMFLVRGEAQVFGFISISIRLLLEATYSSTGRLVGRGSVSLKIKICWCITVKVKASVEYVFSEGKQIDQGRDIATEQRAMYED